MKNMGKRDMGKTKNQKFEMRTIQREKINMATYNPRLIDPENEKKLKKGLKEHGLVMPLVWNARTGNLIAGHQRLKQIDKLERSLDYELDMAVIDVDEREEKILNVQLNNPSMQGAFDFGSLGDLAIDSEINFDEFGFTEFDVNMMFGDDDRFADMFSDTPGVEAAKSDIREIKEHRENMMKDYGEAQASDYYFVVVCESQKEKDDLLKRMSVPIYERYVTAKMLNRLK